MFLDLCPILQETLAPSSKMELLIKKKNAAIHIGLLLIKLKI